MVIFLWQYVWQWGPDIHQKSISHQLWLIGYGRIPTTKISSVENNFTSYTSQNSHFKIWLPMQMTCSNWPLSSSKNPHLENETKCTTLLVRMSFISMRTKNHFHIKGWELNLVLIQRPGGTRKWSIGQISWTTDFLSDFHYCANDQKSKYYISLSQTSSWCLARGLWVWVAEPAIREAHKRVRTNIDKNTLNNLTEQYFYDIKRSFPIFVKYFI